MFMNILKSIVEVGALGGTLSLTGSALDEDLEPGEFALGTTTAFAIIAGSSYASNKIKSTDIAKSYIESLTTEEIVSALELLEEKEKDFVVEPIQNNKDLVVKVKVRDTKKV